MSSKITLPDKIDKMPCYMPAPLFKAYCLNMDCPNIKRLDCDQCVKKFSLKDYIE
uniref:Uncharacterized protein n=1 Tax=viral metagenome TaxID=1070528 RepID=A0A6M3LQZ0_9ZZZZ